MIQLSSIIRQAGLILLVSLNLSAFSQSYQVTSLSGAAYLPLNYTYPTVHSVDICYDEAISDPITENIFIGFHFNYAGSDYASVRVSSNGFIFFVWDGQNLDEKYNNIPTLQMVPEYSTFKSEPIIAPFWGDLVGDEQSKALYTRDAGRFIFEWQNWKWNNTRISFEVILYSGTNIIEFRYKDGPALPNNIKIGLLLPNSGFFGPNNPTAVAGQAYQFTPNVIAGTKIQGLTFSIFTTEITEKFPWEYANLLKGYPGEKGNNMDSVNPIGNGSTGCYEHNLLGYGFDKGPDNRVIPCNFNGYGYPSMISIFSGCRAFNGELTIERTRVGDEMDMGWRFPNDLFYSMFSRSNVMGYRAQMRGGIIENYQCFGKLSYKRDIFKHYDFNNIAVDDQNYKWFCGRSGLIKYKDNYWSHFNYAIAGYISIEKDGTKWLYNNSKVYNFIEYSSAVLYKSIGDDDIDLGHTATSGLPVDYFSTNSNVATIVNGKVHIVGIGTTTIETTQAGNAEYKPLPKFIQTLIVKQRQNIQFDQFTVKKYNDVDFKPAAIASSGLTIAYKSNDTTIAKVVNGYILITGVGTCNIYANQKGDEIYGAAKTVKQTLTVIKADQVISFGNLSIKTFGDADFALEATATSNLAVEYSSSNTDVATIENGKIHIVGAGSSIITATQPGNIYYNEAIAVAQMITVNKADQTISFGALSSKTFGDAPFDLSAYSTSGLDVIFTSSNDDVATVLGKTITIVGAGSAEIVVSQAGNNNYNAAAIVKQTLTVHKKDQTISFNALPVKTFGDSSFDLAAFSTSGLDVTYSSPNTAVLTISGKTVTIVGGGSAEIIASQMGNANYNAATIVKQILVVKKNDQAIFFNIIPVKTFNDKTFDLTAYTTSDLEVTYTSSNTDVATISGKTVMIIGIGSTQITAAQTGNVNYNAALSVMQPLTVNKAEQTIFFGELPSKTYGDADFSIDAYASSNLNIEYISSNSQVATAVNGIIHIVGAGTCTIYANQSGNANYYPAAIVSQTLTVGKAAQTITFSPIPSKTYGDADFGLEASASSGLSVIYTSSNTAVAQVVGGIIHIVGAGESIITAIQEGSNSYNAAPEVSQTLTVGKAAQIITFSPIPSKSYGDADFGLEASASSGLGVTYTSSNTAVAQVVDGIIHIVGAGESIITAKQEGSISFNAAKDVCQTTIILPKPIEVAANSNQKIYGETDPPLTFNVTPSLVNGDAVTGALSRVSGDNVGIYSIQQGTLTFGNNYSITFNGADFKVVNRSLTINAQDKTRDYGVSNPPYTLLFSGFANGDCEAVLDQLPIISCNALQGSNSGSYPIVVVGGFDNNYCFMLRNGTLWVNTILGSVATTAAQNITTTNVDLTGEVLNHGGEENASRGFVYGTTPNPTITNSKVEVGSGIGSYTEVVRNLISNTNYYVRSYVTNSAGTAYGNQLSFTTLTVNVSVTDGCALTIYPNPTSGIVYFENINVNMKVEIFGVDGEFVKRAEICEENNKIDLTDCKAGIYMIRFIFDNRINTIRVVKI